MHVLTLLSQKGGSGKTTLAGHLAVQADRTGAGPVGLLDADPQESLAEWSNARSSPAPAFSQTSLWRLGSDVRAMRNRGMELVVVDTPPGITSTIRGAIDLSDLIVVPVKPSPHDLRAVAKTIKLVEGLGKPLIFVVNCASAWANITAETAIALSQHGTVSPIVIHQRADFATSMIDGRTVVELPRKSRSVEEVADLWDYLSDRLNHVHRTSFAPLTTAASA